jgi:hypothetical protein
VEATGPVRITDTWVKSEVQKKGSAMMDVEVEVFNDSYYRRELVLEVKVTGKNFESKTYTASVKQVCESGTSVYNVPVEIEDPELWWTWDLGEQNLYTVDVLIKDGKGFQDREVSSTGIRTLEMAMNPGWTTEEVEYPITSVRLAGEAPRICLAEALRKTITANLSAWQRRPTSTTCVSLTGTRRRFSFSMSCVMRLELRSGRILM